jgi:hypothetical protein
MKVYFKNPENFLSQISRGRPPKNAYFSRLDLTPPLVRNQQTGIMVVQDAGQTDRRGEPRVRRSHAAHNPPAASGVGPMAVALTLLTLATLASLVLLARS